MEHKEQNAIKMPWGVFVQVVGWVVAGVIAFAAMETKEHAENTFVRRDVFEQYARDNREDITEMKQLLRDISNKLDRKQDRKGDVKP